MKFEILLLKLCVWILTKRKKSRIYNGMRENDCKQFETFGNEINLCIEGINQRNTSHWNTRGSVALESKQKLQIS